MSIVHLALVAAIGTLEDVFSPCVVATPPAAAVRDLCVTAGGEIRHYGWQAVDGQRRRVYLASRDGGANWETHFAERDDVGAMVEPKRAWHN